MTPGVSATDLDLMIPLSLLRTGGRSRRLVSPDSEYAETYWLPVIGPTGLWLLRNLARRVTAREDTFPLTEVAQELGVSRKVLFHTFDRLRRRDLLRVDLDPDLLFKMANDRETVIQHGWFAVQAPTSLPMLTEYAVERLPEHLRRRHVRQHR